MIAAFKRQFSQPKARIISIMTASICVFSLSAIALELSDELIRFIDKRFGNHAVQRLHQWENIANSNTHLTTLQKLDVVNRFFNRASFISDKEHWGKEDYWATPVEMLATNGGDCEDYSIAKYFTLKDMGIPIEQMKITYVKAIELNQAHMVLSFYPEPGAEPLVLDNLINEIKPASLRTDLAPVYSFNGDGLWLSKIRGQQGKRIGSADRLDTWKEMLTRHHTLMKN